MLMAAGLGTRLRPYTGLAPKPLLPLLGVPMAQFAVDQLAAAGVRRIVANVHHLADAASAGLRGLDAKGASIEISDERALLLGSAGGLRHARPLLGGGPFLLVNADVLCDLDLESLAERHRALRADHGVALTLAVFPKGPKGATYREILVDARGERIRALGEPAVGRPYFVGAAVLEPEALAGVPAAGAAEFVPTILEPAIRAGRAGAFLGDGAWHDLGSPKLWFRTHLKLIRALEGGTIPPAWRRRIESVNARLASGIWAPRAAAARCPAHAWEGPAYWSGGGDPRAVPPARLGPRAVLYGPLPEGAKPRHGIGYGGIWTRMPKPRPKEDAGREASSRPA
jgi:MurNAc alpha-1-phosphate uridylyltransferase